jgi:hypothetical protein
MTEGESASETLNNVQQVGHFKYTTGTSVLVKWTNEKENNINKMID